MPLTVGDQIGRIVGAPPGSVAMHQNVTIAEAIVLSCFRPRRRRATGSSTRRASSRRCATCYQAQPRHGVEIVVCRTRRRCVEAIDERTLLVPLSHVLFKTGELQDVGADRAPRARGRRARAPRRLPVRRRGAARRDRARRRLRDRRLVKWLCGGPGAAWLYVRPDLAERLEPALTGWQAHEQPFAFEPELRYAQGAQRFLTGTPNVPALYAATAGYDLIEELGVDRDPRELAAPDDAPDPAARRGRASR